MAAYQDNDERTPACYAVVDGRKIPLTREQQKAWFEMINRNRYYARNFGLCAQPDYRRCGGDCCLCSCQQEGALIYTDDRDRYGDGFASGKYAPAIPPVSVEKQVSDADAWAWLYREADKTARQGGDILRLYLEDGLSAHQIASRTGIAKSTVVDRLNRLLTFIREHRDEPI